jgi:hypothetical protein
MFVFSIFDNNWLWSFFILIMIFISFIPTFLRFYFKISLPFLFDVFICLSFIFHIDYSLYNIFGFIPVYNKFTHFFSAIVVAFIFLILLFVFNEYYRGVAVNTFKILFDVVVITMAFGVVWEFMEWTSDYFFNLYSQPSISDTMGDLFADTLGGLFIAFIGYFLIKRDILRKFSMDFKKHFDNLIDND